MKLVHENKPILGIMIPAGQRTRYEKEAEAELVCLLQELTGLDFHVFTDAELCYAEKAIISLGRTTLFVQSGIRADKEELGFSGYVVKKVGNTVFICGGGDPGTLFGVYAFLKAAFGYAFYAGDEFCFTAEYPYTIPEMDFSEKPDFEFPYLSATAHLANPHPMRHRIVHPWITSEIGWPAHNSFFFLPPDKYRGDHPDWYAVNKAGKELHQLNYNKSDEFIGIVFEKMTEALILTNKKETYREELIYLPFTQEDYNEWDERSESLRELETYGTNAVSLIRFINKLADLVGAWVDEHQPGRQVMLSTFAYDKTVRPPVIYDQNGDLIRDKNGHPIPMDDDFRLRDNVVIRIAPLHSNWYVPLDSDENRKTRAEIEGWRELSDITLWLYSVSFHTMYANLNNFDSIRPNYRYLKKLGVRHLYDEYIAVGKGNPCFRDYRMFLQCRLMWNTDLSVDALTEDFFHHYYRDAADEMLEYLNAVKEVYARKWREIGLDGECNWVELYLPELWEKDTLLKWLKLFVEAYEKIAHYRFDAPALFEKLSDRICMESISVRFLLAYLYGDEVWDENTGTAEKKRLIDDLKRFDMQPRCGYTIDEIAKNELRMQE